MTDAASAHMLKIERDGPVLIVGIDRPHKRNALNEATIA
jgi:enoyl-CoA hydratase/carnithine racemase